MDFVYIYSFIYSFLAMRKMFSFFSPKIQFKFEFKKNILDYWKLRAKKILYPSPFAFTCVSCSGFVLICVLFCARTRGWFVVVMNRWELISHEYYLNLHLSLFRRWWMMWWWWCSRKERNIRILGKIIGSVNRMG